MSNKLISIIIPVYNGEKYIAKCIESILGQSYEHFELLIINDGSTDNTLEVCKKYDDKRMRIINQKNKGVSTARNNGIKNSEGEYIMFVDADDYIEKNCLEIMINGIKGNDICICNYYLVNDEEKVIVSCNNKKGLSFRDLLFDSESNVFGYICGKLIKRSSIKICFNEEIAIREDHVFFLDNSPYINSISMINEPVYDYVINNNSASRNIKWNKRSISVLDATNHIIQEYNNKQYLYNEKYRFINYYLHALCVAPDVHSREIKYKYSSCFKKYYKEVINSKMSFGKKLKMIIKRRLFLIYKLTTKINNKI